MAGGMRGFIILKFSIKEMANDERFLIQYLCETLVKIQRDNSDIRCTVDRTSVLTSC